MSEEIPGGLQADLTPEQRFRGRVAPLTRGWYQWSVTDALTGQRVAWGEEGHWHLTQRECLRAVQGFRWFYSYARAGRVQL